MDGSFHVRAERALLGDHLATTAQPVAMPVQMLGTEPDFEVIPGPLARLQCEIADEASRVDIETLCRTVATPWPGMLPTAWPAPIYDTSQLEPGHLNDLDLIAADQEAIARAVRYLDLRGLLVRPIFGQAQLVSFGGGRG